MTRKIGFKTEYPEKKTPESANPTEKPCTCPRRSLVQVYFPDRDRVYSYYNDAFDLHLGDLVYVEGKLEGLRGRVSEISYNFKIKLSAYKRVIAVADTRVKGRFFMAGSHFVSFDPGALPREKALSWFKAPEAEEPFVSGSDESFFRLEDLKGMKLSGESAERGHTYYMENRVRYICLDGEKGFAIVEGSKSYEVEFEYRKGEIRNLVCSCFCSHNCKHEFAAMLQLKESLDRIEDHYADIYAKNGYFSAITKSAFFNFAVDGKGTGSFTM